LKIALVAVFEFRFFCWPDVNNEKKKGKKKRAGTLGVNLAYIWTAAAGSQV
jgi:hypothetical protein